MRDYAITFTVTIASPAVVTATEHELYIGDEIILFTTGALPTGLTASSVGNYSSYFVIADGITANTFQLSASEDGTPIITTGTQSGTHTFLKLGGDQIVPENLDYE